MRILVFFGHLFLNKTCGAFIREGAFIRINMVGIFITNTTIPNVTKTRELSNKTLKRASANPVENSMVQWFLVHYL